MKIDRSLSKLTFVLLKTIFHFVYTRVNMILTDGVKLYIYIYGIFSGHYLTTFVTIAIIIVMKGT